MLQLLLLKLLPASPPSSCCCSSIKRLATTFWYKYFNTLKYCSIKLSHLYWQLCCCCFLVCCSIKILSVMFRYKIHAAKNSLVATLCFLEFDTLHLWTRPLLLHLLAHFLLLVLALVGFSYLKLLSISIRPDQMEQLSFPPKPLLWLHNGPFHCFATFIFYLGSEIWMIDTEIQISMTERSPVTNN